VTTIVEVSTIKLEEAEQRKVEGGVYMVSGSPLAIGGIWGCNGKITDRTRSETVGKQNRLNQDLIGDYLKLTSEEK
jgi:hypothetical protein